MLVSSFLVLAAKVLIVLAVLVLVAMFAAAAFYSHWLGTYRKDPSEYDE